MSSAFGGFGKPAGSLFGQSNATTQPTGSIFGNTAQQQAQPQQGTSLFTNSLLGQQPQQTQQSTAGTSSLFGGSILGQPPQQQQQQQTMQPPSLFGGFGQTQTQNQPAQQNTNSLFGSTTQQQQQQPQQQQQQQQQQPNLFSGFGSTTANSSNNAFGQSTNAFGQPNQAQGMQRQATMSTFGAPTTNSLFARQPSQQPNLSAQSMGGPLFIRSTKFNDLPDELKKTFEAIDTHIQGRVQISNDLKQRKVGEEASKGQELLRSVHKDLVNAITVLQNDVYHVRDLKTKTDQTVQDTIVATRIIDGFRNPQQNGQYLKTYASFPLEFFERIAEEMRNRLRWYKTTIEQIERKLSSAAAQTQPTPHAITSTLQAQHAIFVSLASRTAALDAELLKVKALYTQLWRAKTGSMRDPFNELDRGNGSDFGMESLSGK